MSWTAEALICDLCQGRFIAGDIAIPGYTMATPTEPDDPRHYHLGCLIRGEEEPPTGEPAGKNPEGIR